MKIPKRLAYDMAIARLKRKGSRFLVSDLGLKRAKEGGHYRITRDVFKGLKQEWTVDGWTLMSIGDCPPPNFEFKKLIDNPTIKLGPHTVINEIYLDESKPPVASSIAKRWMELFPTLEIPFDLKVRREKLKDAYNHLSKYVDAHEAIQREMAEKQKQAR